MGALDIVFPPVVVHGSGGRRSGIVEGLHLQGTVVPDLGGIGGVGNMRAEQHTAFWKGGKGGRFSFGSLHVFIWPIYRRGSPVQLLMGQKCFSISFLLALTVPWVVLLCLPSELTGTYEVGVLGWDHTSLNNATLAVGHDAVGVPVPALPTVEAVAFVAGGVQAAGVIPGRLGKKGGPYGEVALFGIEQGRLVVGTSSGGGVVRPRWYREDRGL